MASSSNRKNAKSRQQRQRKHRKPNPPPPSSAHRDSINTAIAHQQLGELESAKSFYCEILTQDPGNADAWHLLAMVYFAVNDFSNALVCLNKSNLFAPNQPFVLANLGLAHRGLGDLESAKLHLSQAVSLAPQSVNYRTNLGTVLSELKEWQPAIAQFDAVLRLHPDNENAAMNLGNLWQSLNQFRDAELAYRRILKRNPDHALVLANLGEALRHQGRWDEAAQVLQRAVGLNPQTPEVQINLGKTFLNLARHEEAQRLFTDLTLQFPQHAKAFLYLGRAFFEVGNLEPAKENLLRALELNPLDAFARCSLGHVLLEAGQTQEAKHWFQATLEIEPTNHAAHTSLLFVMSSDPELEPQHLFEEHLKWADIHGTVEPLGSHTNDRAPNRRLRVGYVSPDLRNHALAKFFRPVLEAHDRELVETFCYAEVPAPDEMTKILRGLSSHWRSTVGLSDHQVARQIKADEIDILVDLAGHTAGNRLRTFAFRPAPIQVTWLGYPNTTGLKAIDYRLSCEAQSPTGEADYHTEQIVRMKHGSSCFSINTDAPPVAPSPLVARGFPTFGALHRPDKISPLVRELWAAVLQAIPDSRLLLFHTRFSDQSAELVRSDLIRLGVTKNRIEIRNRTDAASYLSTYHEIDIALDVTPWAGSTTTLEALWMGVPAIALLGKRRSARSTAVILHQVGLPELIATDISDYVRIANSLAGDVSRLTAIRSNLRERMKMTVCNADRFTRELEREYRTMWHDWCLPHGKKSA